MNIKEASLNLSHQYAFTRRQQVTEISPPVALESDGQQSSRSHEIKEQKALGPQSARLLEKESHFNWSAGEREDGLTPHWYMVKRLLEAFFGHAVKVSEAVSISAEANDEGGTLNNSHLSDVANGIVNGGANTWVHLSLEETEVSVVSISASITLADGKSVNVLFEEKMARHIKRELDLSSLDAAKYLDPLAINFGGPVELSNKKVEFDLDADGHVDLIPTFASYSRYLALDKNDDGRINDGSELFGALTGDGFAELAVHDEDNNGIIDYRDRVFNQLKVFDPASGKSQSLLGTGVDAIFLQQVASPFSLTDSGGEELGRVKSTGLYLRGDQAGSIQQIDLVV